MSVAALPEALAIAARRFHQRAAGMISAGIRIYALGTLALGLAAYRGSACDVGRAENAGAGRGSDS
jgi:hypothetical protein